MKVVDLHPEELIDRLAAGELSSAERARLDAHLAQCAACRFEMGVRADLDQEAPTFEQRPQLTVPGASPTERARPGALLEPRPAARAAASIRPRARRRWPLVLLAAALVLCAGGATAAVVTGAVRAPLWLRWSPEPTAAQSTAQLALAKSANKAKRLAANSALPGSASSVEPLATGAPAWVVTAPPTSSPTPVALAPSAPLPISNPTRVNEASHGAAVRAPASSKASVSSVAAFPLASTSVSNSNSAEQVAAPAPRSDPAASLFADANRARRDGNADRAVTLYRSLQSRFPSSSESELSRALLAQLLLDRGSPDGALASFDRYLAQGTPVLGAEALVGRARALEQLGRPTQAAAAWREVQQQFPGSVHARLAATRLAALGTR